MPFYLRSHVHAAVLGDDVVILDTRNDAYSCVPGRAESVQPGMLGEEPGDVGRQASREHQGSALRRATSPYQRAESLGMRRCVA